MKNAYYALLTGQKKIPACQITHISLVKRKCVLPQTRAVRRDRKTRRVSLVGSRVPCLLTSF